ncbi:MAG: DMT family transporter [Eubacteriales bacterium]|nr:DMT family transporter [Eubacteriales bacterium]
MNRVHKLTNGGMMEARKRNMYLLMILLVFAWGLEYIFAKQALAVMEPLSLVFFKYMIGLVVALVIKLKAEGKSLMQKRDIPLFLFCAIFGEIGYFYFEYTAMGYLPVSLVTIVLAFVPALSILIDKAVFKKKITKKITIAIFVSILGIALVIGVDYDMLFRGRIIGYLLAFGAVITWNLYNFLTASLHDRYETATLTLNQMICTVLLVWPYALSHLPDRQAVTMGVAGGILYLGIFSTGIGFIIFVRSLYILGPAVTAIFSNFLPVTTTFFGWLILRETILPVQMLGGAIVIAAGYFVIKEKGRLEESSHDGTD